MINVSTLPPEDAARFPRLDDRELAFIKSRIRAIQEESNGNRATAACNAFLSERDFVHTIDSLVTAIERLREIVDIVADASWDPNDAAADGGITALDVLRQAAQGVLAANDSNAEDGQRFDRAAFAADIIAWAEVRQREAVDERCAGHPWPDEKVGRTNMLFNAAELISPAGGAQQHTRQTR